MPEAALIWFLIAVCLVSVVIIDMVGLSLVIMSRILAHKNRQLQTLSENRRCIRCGHADVLVGTTSEDEDIWAMELERQGTQR